MTPCPLTSRTPYPPDFGEYFGDPLVSCTDGHAHQCGLMLGIEATLLGMSAHTRYAVEENLVLVEDCLTRTSLPGLISGWMTGLGSLDRCDCGDRRLSGDHPGEHRGIGQGETASSSPEQSMTTTAPNTGRGAG